MSVTVDDLKPKNFKVNIKGLELECKPLRLSHTLIIGRTGEVLSDPKSASVADIKEAEKNMDDLFAELIPELKDVQLDTMTIMELITQLVDNSQPSDSKFLEENGVKLDADPKVEKAG